jgi:predicted nucleic acid-binding protein
VVKAYPETSFLFNLYAPQAHSARAAGHFAAMREPLHLTSLNRFELVNAIQLSFFRKTIPRAIGLLALKKLDENIAGGGLAIVPCDWAAVHGRALRIAVQHTAAYGGRGIDVLHLATALELGATEFLTFDARQGALAKVIGLKLPLLA